MLFKRGGGAAAAILGLAGVLGLAYAATQVLEFTIHTPIALSTGGNGDKPKIQRAGNGLLVMAYGDSPAGAGRVYDTMADAERLARDAYVRTCNSLTADCDDPANWSAPYNVSQSADKSSISTAWQGPAAGLLRYPGDVDKVSMKSNGPVVVLTWVGNYCPDGDLQREGEQPPVQRAVRYLERASRIVPFACTWMAYSKNNGAAWSTPIQLSTGERDAKQDSSFGNVGAEPTNASYQKGQFSISWQEDPRGLQLGEADGPGDGASGANVSNGTDIWYTWASVNLADANNSNHVVLAAPGGQPRARAHRLTDNFTISGIGGTDEANPVFGAGGLQVDKALIESGQTGASRANIGMVGTTVIVAYEETKGSLGLDEGKFLRYHSFAFNKPGPVAGDMASNDPVGCVLSDPLKNARRARFLTQSATDAGPGGVQLAIFWREGIYDKGGPADIVVRRAMGGLSASHMVPAVDPNCTTSDYATAIGLGSQRAENVSSRSAQVSAADTGLADDTELNHSENALAHRGVLRRNDLWVGYSYTADLVKLWAQIDNYNFWVRKFTFDSATGGSWGLPANLTRIGDPTINVREPRFFGTPGSSRSACPSGDPAAADTTDATLCQDRDVILLAWGTETNVSPFDPAGGQDLGIYITVSRDAGASFATPVTYSTVQGTRFGDEESAFEAQIVARPDGRAIFGVWNQAHATTGLTAAAYASASWAVVDGPDPVVPDPVVPDPVVPDPVVPDPVSPDPVVPDPVSPDPVVPAPVAGDDDGGGCTMAGGGSPIDPTLWLLAGLGLAGAGLRRVPVERRG